MNLTPKQESFSQLVVKYGDYSKAYRESYNSENMKPETVWRKAKELVDNGKVTARIVELQTELKDKNIADTKALLRFWTNSMNNTVLEMKDRLRASEMLAKHLGMFTEKIQINSVEDKMKELYRRADQVIEEYNRKMQLEQELKQ
ncbi:MAG TPA: hypothetical protein DDX29_05835 [Clostridiales bacterium]|nr:hypothetical protein [Clostridiales bacterium]